MTPYKQRLLDWDRPAWICPEAWQLFQQTEEWWPRMSGPLRLDHMKPDHLANLLAYFERKPEVFETSAMICWAVRQPPWPNEPEWPWPTALEWMQQTPLYLEVRRRVLTRGLLCAGVDTCADDVLAALSSQETYSE